MGSALTKNYDVEKEPYISGGQHGLWKVYRAKKKFSATPDTADVSIFMIEKKAVTKKNPDLKKQQELFEILKREAQNLAKFRHPSMLQLIEAPIEDKSLIAFVTEPVEYTLQTLLSDPSKKDLIPSEVDLKCIVLELMECVNFLHANTKSIHMNLAPEHLYFTKGGKLKLGGLSFITPFNSTDPVPVQFDYLSKVENFAMVPNLRFSAPEMSISQTITAQADIFSIGCIIFYLNALNLGKQPHILNLADVTGQTFHKQELQQLDQKLGLALQPLDQNLQFVIRNMLHQDPLMRGSLGQYVQNAWFQDPLLKTIRYLENIHQKEQTQKIQFLGNITKVLDKFDKRTLLRKVIPGLIETMKDAKLSAQVLQSFFYILDRDTLTTTEFRALIWPSIQTLTRSKEINATSLFLLVKNSEQMLKFAQQQEFMTTFIPLLQKSLECGVPKLQLLALEQIQKLFKKIDYNTQFKPLLLPRICQVLETSTDVTVKIAVLTLIKNLQDSIDQPSLQGLVLKTFEKIRGKETDNEVIMIILQIYEKASTALGPEEIGTKILPGIIPMMVTASLSRHQFGEMMRSVRSLLDRIESQKLQSLPENNVARSTAKASAASAEVDAIFEDGTKTTGGFDWLNDKDLFTGKEVFTGISSAAPMTFGTAAPIAFGTAAPMTFPTGSMTLPSFEAKPDLFANLQKSQDPFANLPKSTFTAKPQMEVDPFAIVFADPKFTPPTNLQPKRDSDVKVPDSDLFGGSYGAINQPKQQQSLQQVQKDPFASLKFSGDPFADLDKPSLNSGQQPKPKQPQQDDFFSQFANRSSTTTNQTNLFN